MSMTSELVASNTDSELVLDPNLLPRHIAIIMDGNGRWATNKGLSRTDGHREGVNAVRRTVKAGIELGLEVLTIFSFSSENWSRPAKEIADLFGLLRLFINRDLKDLNKNNVRIRIVGGREKVPDDICRLLADAENKTRENTGLTLAVAFNYGSRDEIIRAVRSLAHDVKSGTLDPDDISAELMNSRLDTADLPEPDLLIRTSGEQRLSNFLLWQLAYAEFVFLDCFWPEFDKGMLISAILQYQQRNRRFGGLSQSKES